MMISLDMIRGDVMKFDEIAIRQKFETKSFKMNKEVPHNMTINIRISFYIE